MDTMSGKIRWIDIAKPDKKEIAYLRKEFGFHSLILGELVKPSARAKVEAYKGYLFLVYHLPVFNLRKKRSERAEIDFLITKDTVVTAYYRKSEVVDSFRQKIEEDAAFRRKALSHTGRFTYYLLDFIIADSIRQLAHIERKIENIAANLFTDKERELLEHISYIKRDILEYHIIAKPQDALLDSLKTVGEKFWGVSMAVYFENLIGGHLQLVQALSNNRDSIESFEQTNVQILNTNISSVMQKFAVLAFLTFPSMLVVALFDIARPIFGNPADALIIVGIVSAVVLCMIIYFHDKKWL